MKKSLLMIAGMCFSLWAGAQTRNITFQVEMNSYTGTFTTPEVNGTWNNWCGNCNVLSDPNNDDIWTVTLPLTQGDTLEFKYSHDNWAGQETLSPAGACTNGNTQFTNRKFIVPGNDSVLSVACWGQCGPCSGQPTTANITFKVDMNSFAGTFTTPEINGTFNNWCGNCAAMTDVNSDDIWEITINMAVGNTIEYKFSHDNWTGQESLDSTGTCTNGNGQSTNRMLVIPAGDTIMPAVCWGFCQPCGIFNSIESIDQFKLKVYPNPASGTVNIQSALAGTLRLMDVTGRVVKEDHMVAGEHSMSLEGINSGLYIVQLNSQNGMSSQRLLVK